MNEFLHGVGPERRFLEIQMEEGIPGETLLGREVGDGSRGENTGRVTQQRCCRRALGAQPFYLAFKNNLTIW